MAEGFITRRGGSGAVFGAVTPAAKNTVTIPDLIGKKYFTLSLACSTTGIGGHVVYALQYTDGIVTVLRGALTHDKLNHATPTEITFDETTGTITLCEEYYYSTDHQFYLGEYTYIGC